MAEQDSYLVMGGCGFLGWTIVEMLLERGEQSVAVFDIVQGRQDKRVHFFIGDMVDQSVVEDAIRKSRATCIIHTASPPHSVPQHIYRRVNVDGTRSIIGAAVALGVPKLVYTSSASVVFDGKDIIGVDERIPYSELPMDQYCKTKIEAERMVLEANGRGSLHTVALRPASIFGPGDRQMIPGLIKVLMEGRYTFQIGDNNNMHDFTYVGNVAKAHLLAADRLCAAPSGAVADVNSPLPPIALSMPTRPVPTSTTLAAPGPAANGHAAAEPAHAARSRFDQFSAAALAAEDGAQLRVAGQAFFITNGEPVPFWSFARGVWRAWGAPYDPARRVIALPASLAYGLAGVAEWACWVLRRDATFTRFRVGIVRTHRWHSIEKARRVLGYEPDVGLQEGIRRSVEWLKAKEAESPGFVMGWH